MRKFVAALITGTLLTACASTEQNSAEQGTVVTLYKAQMISGAKPAENTEKVHSTNHNDEFVIQISQPSLTAYLPDAANRTDKAVIICPGGGYFGLSMLKEGQQVAQRFAQNGISAFVLKHRMPSDTWMEDKSVGPLQDVQQAIAQVKAQAADWGINPQKVGIMGFSAGGHLAASAATHYDNPVNHGYSAHQVKPNFQILVYPVISMQPLITHKGSRTNLLGENPTGEQIDRFSNELNVSETAPPAFIVHSTDDVVVPVANALVYYRALVDNQVPALLTILPDGNHGYGMRHPIDWVEQLLNWVETQ